MERPFHERIYISSRKFRFRSIDFRSDSHHEPQSDSRKAGKTHLRGDDSQAFDRPLALGRKNWLHIGSPSAAPSVAAIISVVESCNRLGLHVRTYLGDVLPRLAAAPPHQAAALAATLTPVKWLAAQTAAQPAAANVTGGNLA
jgi:hypothetical protein